MEIVADVEAMGRVVDTHRLIVDEEIGNLIREMNLRIAKLQQKLYTPKITQLERKIEEQKVSNITMEQRTGQTDEKMQRLNTLVDRIVDHIALMKMRDRVANQKSRVFHAWRDMATSRKVMEGFMVRVYLDEPMKRILFKRWARKMRKARRIRQKRELKRNCDRDIRMKETESSQRIAALQSELVAVKELLVVYEQQHSDMQQKLRRAFMRGVVNLNLEAVDVFGDIPSTDIPQIPLASKTIKSKKRVQGIQEDEDSFFVEPAPRISVIRHK